MKGLHFRRIPSVLVLALVLEGALASMEDASDITWAHAVNSREALEQALASDVDFLEADVSLGNLEGQEGSVPVMAHPPSTTSDITLEQWLIRAANDGRKGLKLDFKSIEVVQPSLLILKRHAAKLKTVWLNADILPGPVNSPTTPVNADPFLSQCRQNFPSATLSVGWTTYWHPVVTPSPSDWRYRWRHVRDMVDTLHCGLNEEAAKTQAHVTFPVRGIFAARSLAALRWLTSVVPNSSLTVWSGSHDPLDVEDLLRIRQSFPKSKVYYDVPEDIREEFAKRKDSVPTPPDDGGREEDSWTTLTKGDGGGCPSLTYSGGGAVVFGRSAPAALLWKTPLDPRRIKVSGVVEFFAQSTPHELALVLAGVSRFAENASSHQDPSPTSDAEVAWTAIDASSVFTLTSGGDADELSCRAFRLDAAADEPLQVWTLPCDAMTDSGSSADFQQVVSERGRKEVPAGKRLVLPDEPLVFGLASKGAGQVAVHDLAVGGAGDAGTTSSSGLASALLTLLVACVGLFPFL